jgi:hypothetical protein
MTVERKSVVVPSAGAVAVAVRVVGLIESAGPGNVCESSTPATAMDHDRHERSTSWIVSAAPAATLTPFAVDAALTVQIGLGGMDPHVQITRLRGAPFAFAGAEVGRIT